ncbi:MAG: hypothetical protein K0B02_00690 [DPANN group archaeon]|nr:hypothetical protein [DPANN group archaeon]
MIEKPITKHQKETENIPKIKQNVFSKVSNTFKGILKRRKQDKYMDILTPEDRLMQQQEYEQRRNRRPQSSNVNMPEYNGFGHLFGEKTQEDKRQIPTRQYRQQRETDVVELQLPHPETFAPHYNTHKQSTADLSKIAKMKERAVEFITRFDKEAEKNKIEQKDPFNSENNAVNSFFSNTTTQIPITPTQNISPFAENISPFTQQEPQRTPIQPQMTTNNIPSTNPFITQDRNPFEAQTLPNMQNVMQKPISQNIPNTKQNDNSETINIFNKILDGVKDENKPKKNTEWNPMF